MLARDEYLERPIDFSRQRHMLCGKCSHQWVVDLGWIDRWDHALERCPGCGVTCEAEMAPRVTVDPDDPALRDENVARLVWYHTSTQPDWPTKHFDPAAGLTAQTRQMMGGDNRVAQWAERQRAKALHVGTYEAAIHNMLRRIDGQADHGNQFYLYRVHLKPTVVVRDGWLIDPSNFVGDVILDEACPPGVDVARYLNYHEDPGGLSLALGPTAIASTQSIAIPLLFNDHPGWIATAVGEFENAPTTSPPLIGSRPVGRRRAPSPKSSKASELVALLTQRLPVNLRSKFEAATAFDDNLKPEDWSRYVMGIMNTIVAPEQVAATLDGEIVRYL
ncbi:hypothetical protein QMG61_10540 [Cryobacterium sp. PH31-AA6]|uniref:hypothetical protein n=1 Tax=Cryobacterium sp. PH31-AA6 TaxID=3046205 RepID=UPI0024B8D809|nr:hypothetical protein [Cryobacterium sp. PH31-AA6]MDJ0324202.1 hypothetical protein [Cryobacterium sp. PH31-AA6]